MMYVVLVGPVAVVIEHVSLETTGPDTNLPGTLNLLN
jgi:hypothetical protein